MKQFAFIITAVLSLLATGCIYDRGDICPVPDEDRENAFVNLCISVAATNSFAPGSAKSRAEGDNYYFEDGIAPYEQIHSLRIIMTNNDMVEYNELIFGYGNASSNEVEGITMRTTPGGVRRIYLIANEKSISNLHPETGDDKLDLASIEPGEAIPVALQTAIISTVDGAGKPLFSNGETFVPMTEIFDVPIMEITDGIYNQRANLFITRAAVKFSLIIPTKIIPTEGTESGLFTNEGDRFRISAIDINSTANCEYLFPTKTTYSPEKFYDLRDGEIVSTVKPDLELNREITKYDVPENAVVKTAHINIPEDAYSNTDNFSAIKDENEFYGILKKDENIFSFSSPAYFPETKLKDGDKYTMDISVGWPDTDEDGNEIWITDKINNIELEGLPYGLPRNTHVLIILTLGKEHTFKATVKLVPYIGVTLDPVFGFEDLVPGKKNNQDSPENTNIPEN